MVYGYHALQSAEMCACGTHVCPGACVGRTQDTNNMGTCYFNLAAVITGFKH